MEGSLSAYREALVGLAVAFRKSCVVHGALSLRLFDALSPTGSSAQQVANATGIAELSARLLLNALMMEGVVLNDGGQYRVRPDIMELLVDGKGTARDELLLYRRENAVWLTATEIFRGNLAPQSYRRELLDSQLACYPSIQRLNEFLGRRVVGALSALITQASHILDIGGGDGLHAGLALSLSKGVRVRVLDLDAGFAMCERHCDALVAGRLELVVGDARTTALPPEHDLVMINELLELFSLEEKREILRLAVNAVAPGGHIVVTKFDLDADGLAPASSALFSLRMRLKTAQSYLETNDEVTNILRSLGCVDLNIMRVASLKAVIVGRVPSLPLRPIPSTATRTDQPMQDDDLTERQISLWGDLVSASTSFRSSAVLFAAVEMDLFSHIKSSGSTADEISEAVGIRDVGVRLVVHALAAMGLLAHEGGRFFLNSDLRGLLTPGPRGITEELLHYRRENLVWLRLADIVMGDAEAREEANRSLEADHLNQYLSTVALSNQCSARLLTAQLAELIGKATRALDVGGGKGDYSHQLLAANPELKVTLLDRASVINAARRHVGQLWPRDRLELLAGDALNLQLDAIYDLVLISDLLHYFSDDDKRRILDGARRAAMRGGVVIVSKFTLEPCGTQPPSAPLFSLKIHLKRPEAYLEADERTAELMRNVGLKEVQVKRLNALKTVLLGYC